MVRKRAFLAFVIALFFPLNMRAVYRTGARGATLGDFGALACLLRRCSLLVAMLYTCQARRVLAAFWRVSVARVCAPVAGACRLVASTYRRGAIHLPRARPWFPGASIQGGVILRSRGQGMRTGGRSGALMASTYRRSYPPATGPALVPLVHSVQGGVILWIRGHGMRTGGKSVPLYGFLFAVRVISC